MPLTRILAVALGYFLSCCASLDAQPLARIELPAARFVTGDDMRYAETTYPDSTWSLIDAHVNWEKQGFDSYNGFAWYRFHFFLPASLRHQAWWPDTLRIFLGKIDDADEVFLNGQQMAKHGSFPADPGGYISQWNTDRDIHLSSSHQALRYNQENILAIRVYDGDGPGGMFGPTAYLQMLDIGDAILIRYADNTLSLTNRMPTALGGELDIQVIDPARLKPVHRDAEKILLEPQSCLTKALALDPHERLEIQASFTDSKSGRSVSFRDIPPYILTPPAPSTPRIHTAPVFGVRPGSPFLLKIAATGNKPIRYEARDLPRGLQVDPTTGIITGKLRTPGQYTVTLYAANSEGTDQKTLIIRCGELIALTPPLGWNSWNCWGLSVSDAKVRASARAMIEKGLIDHGWTYINIDDGWEAPQRKKNGTITTNEKFPAIRELGDWLHQQGLKLGIYSSPGPHTCGGYLGSYQHEEQDARTWRQWGVDYLKYDWCSYGRIHGGKDTSLASYVKPYRIMQHALRQQPRDIVYSLCQYGMKKVWEWGAEVDGNCWRTTGDIEDTWESLYRIAFNQLEMAPYARPGRWNDPDMLIVGQVGWGEQLHTTRLKPDEQYAHISLWSLLAAPLLIGCDISRMDDFTLNLLTNDEVLAINQDPAGIQATRVLSESGYQVWMKPLADGSYAVGIFNVTEEDLTIDLSFSAIGLEGSWKVMDAWRQKDQGIHSTFSSRVPSHGVTLLLLRQF